MEILREVNLLSIFVRVVLALLIGGLIGIERGRKNRPAGFRTYMLVCLGSTLVMMTNQYVFQAFNTSDPVRMGAQVVSGIGFLGAGTIMVTGRHQVKGITTAAGLWAAACCGLAIGIGFYEGALIGGATTLFVMAALGNLDETIRKHGRMIELYVEFSSKKPFSSFLQFMRENDFEMTDIQINKNKYVKDVDICAIISVRSCIKRSHEEMMEFVANAAGISYVEEL